MDDCIQCLFLIRCLQVGREIREVGMEIVYVSFAGLERVYKAGKMSWRGGLQLLVYMLCYIIEGWKTKVASSCIAVKKTFGFGYFVGWMCNIFSLEGLSDTES